jgi:predicted permease
MVSVLALQYDRDAVFASEGVLLSTVLSMVTIPVIVYIVM